MPIRWQDFIEENPDIMLGKPVLRGTRLTVEHILRELAAGTTTEALLGDYPNLRLEHIRAVHQFAADVVAMDDSLYR